MNHLFVPYKIALQLKEKGFNEDCLAYYQQKLGAEVLRFIWEEDTNPFNNLLSDTITAPLYQQVIDWFRETHNLVINVYANASGYCFELHDSAAKGGSHRYDSDYTGPNESGCWDNFYEANQAAILYSLKII